MLWKVTTSPDKQLMRVRIRATENSLKWLSKKFDWKQKELKCKLLLLTFAMEKQHLILKKKKITKKHWESRKKPCHLSDLQCPWCRPSSVVQLHILSCLKISFPLTHENHCFWGTWLTGKMGAWGKQMAASQRIWHSTSKPKAQVLAVLPLFSMKSTYFCQNAIEV